MGRMMRAAVLAAGVLAAGAAQAGELEPALGLRLAFDGRGVQQPHLGLRLDYADHGIAAHTDELRLPAAMELAYTGAGRLGLYANGLLVKAGPALRVTQDEEVVDGEESSFWDGWGFNTGTVLLAGAAGLALIVAVGGDEAEDLQNNNTSGGGDGDGTSINGVGPGGIGCVGDTCVIPCEDGCFP